MLKQEPQSIVHVQGAHSRNNSDVSSEEVKESRHKHTVSDVSVASTSTNNIPILNDFDTTPKKAVAPSPALKVPHKFNVAKPSRKSAIVIATLVLVFMLGCGLAFGFAFRNAYHEEKSSAQASLVYNGTVDVQLSLGASSTITASTVTPAMIQSYVAQVSDVPISKVSIMAFTSSACNLTVQFANTSSTSDPFTTLRKAATQGHYMLLRVGCKKVTNLDSGASYPVCYTCGTTLPPTVAPTAPPTNPPTTASPTVAITAAPTEAAAVVSTPTPTPAPTTATTVVATPASTIAAATTAPKATSAPTAAAKVTTTSAPTAATATAPAPAPGA
jgi:hypothetical protein